MNDKERVKITKNTSEVLISLTEAIDQAGGCVNIEHLLNMSMLEFISHVCVPNGVRFTCVKTKPVEEHKEEFYYDNPEGDEFLGVVDKVTCSRCSTIQSPYHIYDNPRWKFYCRSCFALFGQKGV
jgi:hypothetical protein